jgi:hypothetical protein
VDAVPYKYLVKISELVPPVDGPEDGQDVLRFVSECISEPLLVEHSPSGE